MQPKGLRTKTSFRYGCDNKNSESFIEVSELPAESQTFLSTHFNGVEVSYVMKDRDGIYVDYNVHFTTGGYVEFDKDGAWEKVSRLTNGVPNSVVPAAILSYIQEKFPDAVVLVIEKERRKYDLELNNGLELLFDYSGNLIEIDN